MANKILKMDKFIEIIQGLGKVFGLVVKEKRKKFYYLISTNLHLSALGIIKNNAKRWKTQEMNKIQKNGGVWRSFLHPTPCDHSLSELLRLSLPENPPMVKGYPPLS